MALQTYPRLEVSRHNRSDDAWIVVHGKVYDMTRWLERHPGGVKLLLNHAGEDATVSWMLWCY